jgi:hypothetical protein
MKGTALDLTTIVVVALVLSITMAGILYSWNILHPILSSKFNTDADVIDKGNTALLRMPAGITMVLFGMIILAGAMAYRVPSEPIFLPVSIIIWGIAIFGAHISKQIATGYIGVLGQENNLGILYYFLSNLDYTIGIAGFVIILLMYLFGRNNYYGGGL